MENPRYWIVLASKDHVQKKVESGFMQASHGEASPLKRLNINDWMISYSPKLEFGGKEKCQAFTAIGRVTGKEIYDYDMGNGFTPFGRDIQFFDGCEVSILPLIPHLDFIQNKRYWGYIFRFGLWEIQKPDLDLVASLMLPNREIIKGVKVDIAEKSGISV